MLFHLLVNIQKLSFNSKPKATFALDIFNVNLIIACSCFSSVVTVSNPFVNNSSAINCFICFNKSFIKHRLMCFLMNYNSVKSFIVQFLLCSTTDRVPTQPITLRLSLFISHFSTISRHALL